MDTETGYGDSSPPAVRTGKQRPSGLKDYVPRKIVSFVPTHLCTRVRDNRASRNDTTK